MIIILKRGADREKVEELKASLTEKGLPNGHHTHNR